MYTPILVLVVLTLLPLIHVLMLERTEGSWVSRIVCFLVLGSLSVGWYGTGAVAVVMHYLSISRFEENYQPLGVGPGIGFAWFLVITGLFILRHWFGVIFNRVGSVWYSD